MSLSEARIKHAALRARVLNDKIDPVGEKRAAKAARAHAASVPSFGEMADQYIASHEASWKNPKHRDQWVMTLGKYCSAIRELPVDKLDAKAVLKVLQPIWTTTPKTASRLRGRIEAVFATAQVQGCIDPDRPNPARWKGWLAQMLPDPKKLGQRGNHASMPWPDVPAFFAKLADAPGSAAKALAFAILTCARTSEVIGMTFDEIDGLDGDKPTWIVPKERMKMSREHRVFRSATRRSPSCATGSRRARPPRPGRTRSYSPRPCRAQAPQQHGAGDDHAPSRGWRVHRPWLPLIGAVVDGRPRRRVRARRGSSARRP